MKEALLIFDVGKTNKKVLLFDRKLEVLHQEEERFNEQEDEDGFPCEDAQGLELWLCGRLAGYMEDESWKIRGVNISTYGATLVYMDEQEQRLGPIYNYLKPFPKELLQDFFRPYGGRQEFFRNTASPDLGMLNAGFQLLWLKHRRPEFFSQVKQVLHLPQYLSRLIHGQIRSEHTSLGCHTAMWDFDRMQYHPWLEAEGIRLPPPSPVGEIVAVIREGVSMQAGIGIHDSSASLVPYLESAREKFILVSTGTWCISMNPFNGEKLTGEELSRDCLCFLSARQQAVKSARFFLGRIHDVNVEHLEKAFGMKTGSHRDLHLEAGELSALANIERLPVFFSGGIPEELLDTGVNLAHFPDFQSAYANLMADLCRLTVDSIRLVIPARDDTRHIYISGGFARNPYFTGLLSLAFPEKEVYTSRVDNATSLGAAMVIHDSVWEGGQPSIDLGLNRISPKK